MVASSWSCHDGMDNKCEWFVHHTKRLLIVKSGRKYVIWWSTSKCNSESASTWLNTPRNMCQNRWHHVLSWEFLLKKEKTERGTAKVFGRKKRLESPAQVYIDDIHVMNVILCLVTQRNSWVFVPGWLVWSVIQLNTRQEYNGLSD